MGKSGDAGAADGPEPALLTSFHVRKARAGDRRSLDWLIERFSPLLRAAAEYRMTGSLRRLYDPEDIVHDVWVTALPRLEELSPRDERYTPVLLKFLSTTLLYKVKNLVQKHIRGKPPREERKEGPGTGLDPLDRVAAKEAGPASRLVRKERKDMVASSLDKLDPRDRELIILRGIEQHAYAEISAILGEDAKQLAVRYQRALKKLRSRLPGSIYDELDDS